MMDLIHFQKEAHVFLDRLFQILKDNKIDFGNDDIDHLCYRTTSQENYKEICENFSKFADLLIESPVNGRLISTFKLSKSIEYLGRCIDLVEVPAPKPGKVTKEGFEHIEIVTSQTFESLKSKYTHLKMDLVGLSKDFNQELEIEFHGMAIKFHHYSLDQVIELEKNERVSKAIEKSGVLKKLKKYSPLISGTFPLGLAVENSDVDVLVGTGDSETMAKIFKQEFSNFPDFKIHKTQWQNQETWIAKFHVDQVPFEIFWQQTPSVEQNAHRHFIVEARLLKIFGDSLKEKVLELKKSGLKTEPAFAKALGIDGDPYEQLLKLHSVSEAHLRKFLQQA